MLGKSTKENKPSVEVGSGAGVFRFEYRCFDSDE